MMMLSEKTAYKAVAFAARHKWAKPFCFGVYSAVYAAEKLYGAGNGDQKLAYAEEILRKHGIRLDTATLKAMIDAQIKEMENMEPFYLADAKVEMIDDPKLGTA